MEGASKDEDGECATRYLEFACLPASEGVQSTEHRYGDISSAASARAPQNRLVQYCTMRPGSLHFSFLHPPSTSAVNQTYTLTAYIRYELSLSTRAVPSDIPLNLPSPQTPRPAMSPPGTGKQNQTCSAPAGCPIYRSSAAVLHPLRAAYISTVSLQPQRPQRPQQLLYPRRAVTQNSCDRAQLSRRVLSCRIESCCVVLCCAVLCYANSLQHVCPLLYPPRAVRCSAWLAGGRGEHVVWIDEWMDVAI
ncbi:hypothetical protein EDC01DRAFT_659616 [Geopyxis carbonaria]|nr:hypothetical protein EDC01DRAFT_659616 [Geopyxis carbonaria]